MTNKTVTNKTILGKLISTCLFSAARVLLAAMLFSCVACTAVNPDKVASFESQNRILREQNDILKGELAQQQTHERELAQRLSQAEIELAKQQQPNTTRR